MRFCPLPWPEVVNPAPFIFCIHMPCESIFWFRIPKHLACHPTLEILRLWKLRGKNQSIKTRLIDEDRLALVVRTRVLNQHSGFTKLVVGTHTQASLPHPYPRTKVHCLSPLSSLHRSSNPYHGAYISPIYGTDLKRTWNGGGTDLSCSCFTRIGVCAKRGYRGE